MKFEQKNFALSSNGYNFPLMVRRSIREFVEHDEQDGFYLSRFILFLYYTNERTLADYATLSPIILLRYLVFS